MYRGSTPAGPTRGAMPRIRGKFRRGRRPTSVPVRCIEQRTSVSTASVPADTIFGGGRGPPAAEGLDVGDARGASLRVFFSPGVRAIATSRRRQDCSFTARQGWGPFPGWAGRVRGESTKVRTFLSRAPATVLARFIVLSPSLGVSWQHDHVRGREGCEAGL